MIAIGTDGEKVLMTNDGLLADYHLAVQGVLKCIDSVIQVDNSGETSEVEADRADLLLLESLARTYATLRAAGSPIQFDEG